MVADLGLAVTACLLPADKAVVIDLHISDLSDLVSILAVKIK